MRPCSLPIVFNDYPYEVRGIALSQRPPGLPMWIVDVSGSKGMAQSWEAALLLACRGAESIRKAEREP